MSFRLYFETAEHIMKDVRKTLGKLPKPHADLVKGWKFKFQDGNGLKNDIEHIGYMDRDNKTIVVAAPWNYGREYAFLHEVAHLVWEAFMTDELKKKWKEIVQKTEKPRQHQGMEELFCMAYANRYAKNKIVIHNHETWDEFMKNLPS